MDLVGGPAAPSRIQRTRPPYRSTPDRSVASPDPQLRGLSRPEFLNRIDEIIIFRSLTRQQIEHVVDIMLANLEERLGDRKLHIVLTEPARQLIANEGYDPVYGARPLKRTIQRRILDPLAMEALQGHFKEGDTVEVDNEGGKLVFKKAAEAEPEREPATATAG